MGKARQRLVDFYGRPSAESHAEKGVPRGVIVNQRNGGLTKYIFPLVSENQKGGLRPCRASLRDNLVVKQKRPDMTLKRTPLCFFFVWLKHLKHAKFQERGRERFRAKRRAGCPELRYACDMNSSWMIVGWYILRSTAHHYS